MANLRVSARHITGKTKDELQLLLVLYQTRRTAQVKIISISPDPEGGWTAWFYDEAPGLPSLTEVMTNNVKGK